MNLIELPTLDIVEGNFVFPCVNPNELPKNILNAFDMFMSGQTAPHFTYVYEHDYLRFKTQVEKGNITIEPTSE